MRIVVTTDIFQIPLFPWKIVSDIIRFISRPFIAAPLVAKITCKHNKKWKKWQPLQTISPNAHALIQDHNLTHLLLPPLSPELFRNWQLPNVQEVQLTTLKTGLTLSTKLNRSNTTSTTKLVHLNTLLDVPCVPIVTGMPGLTGRKVRFLLMLMFQLPAPILIADVWWEEWCDVIYVLWYGNKIDVTWYNVTWCDRARMCCRRDYAPV